MTVPEMTRRPHRPLPGGPHRVNGWTPPPQRTPDLSNRLADLGRQALIVETEVADLTLAVVRARAAGATWAAVGEQLGVPSKVAWSRYVADDRLRRAG